jgi:hypothetical protein
MRGRTFRNFIQSGEADRVGTREEEAEVERDALIARELHEEVLLPFLAKHIDLENDDFVLPALIRAAAIHALGRYRMTPDDFAELARIVANDSTAEVTSIMAKLGALLNNKQRGKSGAAKA